MPSRTLALQASALRYMGIDMAGSTASSKAERGDARPSTDFMINPVPISVRSFPLSCSEMDTRHWLYACLQKPFLRALLFQPFLSIHLQKLHPNNNKKNPYLTVFDIYGILRKGRVLTGQDLGRKRKKVRESLPGTASLLRDIANLLQNPPHFLLLGLSGELFCLLRRSLKSESRVTAIWKGFLDLDPAPFWEMLRDGR